MLRGLWTLTWVEIKIFVREPLGVVGTVGVPVVIFVALGRFLSGISSSAEASDMVGVRVPVFGALLIVLSGVTSLVAIISIYREGGILKRLRATPLRPQTILLAQVFVKLFFTAVTLGVMMLAGRRFYPVGVDFPIVGFTLALLLSTWSMLSVGFVIASLVPTARFAQPIASVILYPMVALSGLFVPLEALPGTMQLVGRVLPLNYAVSLLEGILRGESWWGHSGDVVALVGLFTAYTILSARVFRWE